MRRTETGHIDERKNQGALWPWIVHDPARYTTPKLFWWIVSPISWVPSSHDVLETAMIWLVVVFLHVMKIRPSKRRAKYHFHCSTIKCYPSCTYIGRGVNTFDTCGYVQIVLTSNYTWVILYPSCQKSRRDLYAFTHWLMTPAYDASPPDIEHIIYTQIISQDSAHDNKVH